MLFWHEGHDDFYKKALKLTQFINAMANKYALFQGKKFKIIAESKSNLADLQVSVNGKLLDNTINHKTVSFEFLPNEPGEYKIILQNGAQHTFIRLLSLFPLEQIFENRCRFIVGKQQYRDVKNPFTDLT